MAITNAEHVKSQIVLHIRLDNITILILLIWISWLMAHTCCKSKLGDAVKSFSSFDQIWFNYTILLWLIFFRHWVPRYLLWNLIIRKYIWIEFLEIIGTLHLVWCQWDLILWRSRWNSLSVVVWYVLFNLMYLLTASGWWLILSTIYRTILNFLHILNWIDVLR